MSFNIMIKLHLIFKMSELKIHCFGKDSSSWGALGLQLKQVTFPYTMTSRYALPCLIRANAVDSIDISMNQFHFLRSLRIIQHEWIIKTLLSLRHIRCYLRHISLPDLERKMEEDEVQSARVLRCGNRKMIIYFPSYTRIIQYLWMTALSFEQN